MASPSRGPLDAGRLGDSRLLDIARDHPETVEVLEGTGVPVGEWGRVILDSLPAFTDLAESIARLTAWRGRVGDPFGF